MIIVYAINLVVSVYGEWHSVQTLVADAASEAARMIRLAHRLQNLKIMFVIYTTLNEIINVNTYHLHNQMTANVAFLRSLLEARILQTQH